MENIILRRIDKTGNRISYFFDTTEGLSPYFKDNVLFCEFEEDMSGVPDSILSMAFVGSFIGLSWMTNSSFWVPDLDESYYHSMKWVKNAFQEMYSAATLRGRLIPSKITSNRINDTGNALLLFGGGVDAHCTFIRHIDEIKYICNIQGWYKNEKNLKDSPAAIDDKNHCEMVAGMNGKGLCFVRSNFASVFNKDLFDKNFFHILKDQWWHGLQHSMAFISIASVYAYKKELSKIYIGSSLSVGNNRPCASFITTDSEFRYGDVGRVYHDAFELTRQEKVRTIVEYQKGTNVPYPVKVCSFNDRNCCECEKCFRTIIEIVSEGGNIKDFGFDIKDESLTDFYKRVFNERLALWGIKKELDVYGYTAFKRMRENYEIIQDKEFVDWITSYDFKRNKKRLLREYYRKNFFSIIKRKLHL